MDPTKHDEVYLRMAVFLGKDCSYCERLKVGCLIVSDGHIIGNGYNGTPPGDENVCEVPNPDSPEDLITKPEVIHAEINAISKCIKKGISTSGSTIYVSHSPCFFCANLILVSDISRVVYAKDYRDDSGIKYLRKHNVVVTRVGFPEELKSGTT